MCKYIFKNYKSDEDIYIVDNINRKTKTFQELEESISHPPLFSDIIKTDENKFNDRSSEDATSEIEFISNK